VNHRIKRALRQSLNAQPLQFPPAPWSRGSTASAGIPSFQRLVAILQFDLDAVDELDTLILRLNILRVNSAFSAMKATLPAKGCAGNESTVT